jgi:uncharacterized membrane protein YgdD (TMEM256/DUF423 family)
MQGAERSANSEHAGVWLLWAGLYGFLGVACGAFAAHVLRGKVEPRMLEVFQTGARYQLVHAVALLGVGCLAGRVPRWVSRVAGICFVVGIALFSGSLYALVASGVKWLGAITPFGGVALLVGWIVLAVGGRRAKSADWSK